MSSLVEATPDILAHSETPALAGEPFADLSDFLQSATMIPTPVPSVRTNGLGKADLNAAFGLLQQGQYAQALVLSNALIRLHGDHHALLEIIAVCHRKQDAPESAIAARDRALTHLNNAEI